MYEDMVQQWKRKYSIYNTTNLHTINVINICNAGFKFVHKSHPVVDWLSTNPHWVQQARTFDMDWFKVNDETFQTMCMVLNKSIFSYQGEVEESPQDRSFS